VDTEERIQQLEREIREMNRALVGVQEVLRKAARFNHDDLEKRLDGIQFLLAKAAEYKPRPQQRGRR
jgi:hypothetical protein